MRESEYEREDDVRPEDGLARYWMFVNGEQLCLFAGLGATFSAVLWCFLYFLGAGQSALGIVLLVIGGLCFGTWWFLGRTLREYEEKGWKKESHTGERDEMLLPVAIGLWLFIFIFFGCIIILLWRHGR